MGGSYPYAQNVPFVPLSRSRKGYLTPFRDKERTWLNLKPSETTSKEEVKAHVVRIHFRALSRSCFSHLCHERWDCLPHFLLHRTLIFVSLSYYGFLSLLRVPCSCFCRQVSESIPTRRHELCRPAHARTITISLSGYQPPSTDGHPLSHRQCHVLRCHNIPRI